MQVNLNVDAPHTADIRLLIKHYRVYRLPIQYLCSERVFQKIRWASKVAYVV